MLNTRYLMQLIFDYGTDNFIYTYDNGHITSSDRNAMSGIPFEVVIQSMEIVKKWIYDIKSINKIPNTIISSGLKGEFEVIREENSIKQIILKFILDDLEIEHIYHADTDTFSTKAANGFDVSWAEFMFYIEIENRFIETINKYKNGQLI